MQFFCFCFFYNNFGDILFFFLFAIFDFFLFFISSERFFSNCFIIPFLVLYFSHNICYYYYWIYFLFYHPLFYFKRKKDTFCYFFCLLFYNLANLYKCSSKHNWRRCLFSTSKTDLRSITTLYIGKIFSKGKLLWEVIFVMANLTFIWIISFIDIYTFRNVNSIFIQHL